MGRKSTPADDTSSAQSPETDADAIDALTIEETSADFQQRWDRLISTTNWEKGRIIHEWRESLEASEAPVAEYSDEAWSRRVGNVTPQHVGRLRRVWSRFGSDYETYAGLYWSHFLAGLDWDDAEMYLEGAVQSKWSVSQMRQQRWEAIGAPDNLKPEAGDIVASDLDEDAPPQLGDDGDVVTAKRGVVQDAGDDSAADNDGNTALDEASYDDDESDAPADSSEDFSGGETAAPVQPFANLPELPTDLADAFEDFKLAILHHKLDGWKRVSRDDTLATLDALKELVLAESE